MNGASPAERCSGDGASMSLPLDEIFEAARVAAEARRQPLLDQTARIRSALDDYAHAVGQALVAEVAEKLGVERAPTPSPVEAADTLLKLVLDLPELKAQAAEEPLGPDLWPLMPVPRPSLESYEAGPETRDLWQEVNDLDFAGMSVPMFKAVAALLAARARVLQDQGDNAELIPERVIKKLTAIAGERHITGIYGLARYHQGDWSALAEKAEAEIERLRSGTGLTQKLKIPAAIIAKVVEEAAPGPEHDEEDDEPVVESLPKLQALSRLKPVVLVGGQVENKKLELIKRRFGLDPEWIETDGIRAVQALERRVTDRRISAVVFLNGLLGHTHFGSIISAARQTGVPVAYADTAGTGALRKAFTEIEERLA